MQIQPNSKIRTYSPPFFNTKGIILSTVFCSSFFLLFNDIFWRVFHVSTHEHIYTHTHSCVILQCVCPLFQLANSAHFADLLVGLSCLQCRDQPEACGVAVRAPDTQRHPCWWETQRSVWGRAFWTRVSTTGYSGLKFCESEHLVASRRSFTQKTSNEIWIYCINCHK